jgi:hypothetical protein
MKKEIKKYVMIIEFKKNYTTWSSAVEAFNRKEGTECTKMDGTRAKKLSVFFNKISSENKEKMAMYFNKNVIAVNPFIEAIPKIENYGVEKLINWVESKTPENPEVRKKNYGQLNLKDYFKFMATKEF